MQENPGFRLKYVVVAYGYVINELNLQSARSFSIKCPVHYMANHLLLTSTILDKCNGPFQLQIHIGPTTRSLSFWETTQQVDANTGSGKMLCIKEILYCTRLGITTDPCVVGNLLVHSVRSSSLPSSGITRNSGLGNPCTIYDCLCQAFHSTDHTLDKDNPIPVQALPPLDLHHQNVLHHRTPQAVHIFALDSGVQIVRNFHPKNVHIHELPGYNGNRRISRSSYRSSCCILQSLR